MLLGTTIGELIVKFEPRLPLKYIWKNKHGKPILYVKLKNGKATSSITILRRLLDTLIDWGFKLNEYDLCRLNKTINGKHCTIKWHAGEKLLEGTKFGKESHITMTCSKILEYLGMTSDYTTKGKEKISMHEYIKILNKLPLDM